MAPKMTKTDNTAEVDVNLDPLATMAKDVNFWRFMIRYTQETDSSVNVNVIKKIGNLPHTSAYRKLGEAKKLEGVVGDDAPATNTATSKNASKRKLAAEDSADDDDEPNTKNGKKTAGSDVKANGKKPASRKSKKAAGNDSTTENVDAAIDVIDKKPTSRKAKKNVDDKSEDADTIVKANDKKPISRKPKENVDNDSDAIDADEPAKSIEEDDAKPKKRVRKPSARAASNAKKITDVNGNVGEADEHGEDAQEDDKRQNGAKAAETTEVVKECVSPVGEKEEEASGAGASEEEGMDGVEDAVKEEAAM